MNHSYAAKYIRQQDDLQKYAPPGHSGTVNVRLTDRSFCGNFEMILGELQPGGSAHKHHHESEYQAIYILSGKAQVTLAEEAPVECGPGAVIELPPKLDHYVISIGPDPLKLLIVYSPPLPKRNDRLL